MVTGSSKRSLLQLNVSTPWDNISVFRDKTAQVELKVELRKGTLDCKSLEGGKLR